MMMTNMSSAGNPHGPPPPGPHSQPPQSHTPHQRLGMTTYYRTISVDNKPTTVIIGPSESTVREISKKDLKSK